MTEHTDRSGTPDKAERAADSLLAKLRTFVRDELDDAERAAFAVLLAPALVELGSGSGGDTDDVAGFAVGATGPDAAAPWLDPAERWAPGPLPDQLARAVRAGRLRVVADE